MRLLLRSGEKEECPFSTHSRGRHRRSDRPARQFADPTAMRSQASGTSSLSKNSAVLRTCCWTDSWANGRTCLTATGLACHVHAVRTVVASLVGSLVFDARLVCRPQLSDLVPAKNRRLERAVAGTAGRHLHARDVAVNVVDLFRDQRQLLFAAATWSSQTW